MPRSRCCGLIRRSWWLRGRPRLPPPSPPRPGGRASAEALARQLANPIASLISVPFQSNFDFNAGQDHDKFKYTLNIQPVIPLSISEEWNLITRIFQPVIYQDALFPGLGSTFGLGDMTPSFFFSPEEPFQGWIWGAGPVFLLPTATDNALGTGQWGAGPTAVGLRQRGPWNYGLLANHLWSFAGEGGRPGALPVDAKPRDLACCLRFAVELSGHDDRRE